MTDLKYEDVCDLGNKIKKQATTIMESDDQISEIFTPDKDERTILKLIEYWLNHYEGAPESEVERIMRL